MIRFCKFVVFLCLIIRYDYVSGHGLLSEPLNRGSLWRRDPSFPINYDDSANYCGGRAVQWDINNGKCGICGDDYRDPVPRANENGGKYGQGEITAVYKRGDAIPVTVWITANHRGWFQFSVCKLDKPDQLETENCFTNLTLTNGSPIYVVPTNENDFFSTVLQLPDDLVCERCVLRWHYNTGNSWGQCEDGSEGMGCGPQENFRTCSDIRIIDHV